ncbi:MAG: hypothetical protein HC896_04165 [Bacteroidales bacterium]|nr:hypothetical protein [Bacteroidales bacterium]
MIIWMADRLNATASNKLLKLIEEPPENTVFLLVAESSENILPTIVSRTQIINVPRIKHTDIAQALQAEHGLPEQASVNIARIANGSYVTAVELLNSSEELDFNFEKFTGFMRMTYGRKWEEIFIWVEEMSQLGRERLKSFFNYTQRLLRENYMLSLGNAQLAYLKDNEQEFSDKFHLAINWDNAPQMVHELNSAAADIERNAYNKIVLLDLALKVTKLIKK